MPTEQKPETQNANLNQRFTAIIEEQAQHLQSFQARCFQLSADLAVVKAERDDWKAEVLSKTQTINELMDKLNVLKRRVESPKNPVAETPAAE